MNEILDFIDERIRVNERGDAFALTADQREVLELAFAFDAEGRLPWDTIVYSCPKKSGKTTINAAATLAWAVTQEAPNEVYVLANDQEQAKGRVYASVAQLMRKNGMGDWAVYGERGLAQGGFELMSGTIVKALGADAAGAAGSNHGFTSWDELWAYASERMRRLWEELTPVPTRQNSVRFITTYAGFEGESLTLWDLYVAGVGSEEHPEGRGERLPNARDLPIFVNREARLFVYWDHVARMPWQTEAYYAAERRRLRPGTYLRLHENRWTTGRTLFLEPAQWHACEDPELRPVVRDPALPVIVGADAATKKDSAALVAVTFDEVRRRPRVVTHALFQPGPGEPIDLEATVEATVLAWAGRYQILAVVYDPYQFVVIAKHLAAAGLVLEEFPQTTDRLTAMGQLLWDLVTHRNLDVYVDEAFRAHVGNAVAVETPRGLRIAKEKARHKIDLCVALAMALRRLVQEPDAGALQVYLVGEAPAAEPEVVAAEAGEDARARRAREELELEERQARELWRREEAWRS